MSCASERPICGVARAAAPASVDFRKLRRLIRKVLNLSRPAHINHVLLKFLTNLDRRSGEDGPKAALGLIAVDDVKELLLAEGVGGHGTQS